MKTPKPPKKTKPVKKQFETTWSETTVLILDKLTLTQQSHFDGFYETSSSPRPTEKLLIHPDTVPYRELLSFLGKRTRITIEVLG